MSYPRKCPNCGHKSYTGLSLAPVTIEQVSDQEVEAGALAGRFIPLVFGGDSPPYTLAVEAAAYPYDLCAKVHGVFEPRVWVGALEAVAGQVTVRAGDPYGNVAEMTFDVVVTEPPPPQPPVLGLIDNQAIPRGCFLELQLDITDPDTATADLDWTVSWGSHAETLRALYGLRFPDTDQYHQNARGSNERYLQGVGETGWFYIMPTGALYEFTGEVAQGSPLEGNLLHTGLPAWWEVPPLLYAAADPDCGWTVSTGGLLAFTPPGNFRGLLDVTVAAHDGDNTTSRTFCLRVG